MLFARLIIFSFFVILSLISITNAQTSTYVDNLSIQVINKVDIDEKPNLRLKKVKNDEFIGVFEFEDKYYINRFDKDMNKIKSISLDINEENYYEFRMLGESIAFTTSKGENDSIFVITREFDINTGKLLKLQYIIKTVREGEDESDEKALRFPKLSPDENWQLIYYYSFPSDDLMTIDGILLDNKNDVYTKFKDTFQIINDFIPISSIAIRNDGNVLITTCSYENEHNVVKAILYTANNKISMSKNVDKPDSDDDEYLEKNVFVKWDGNDKFYLLFKKNIEEYMSAICIIGFDLNTKSSFLDKEFPISEELAEKITNDDTDELISYLFKEVVIDEDKNFYIFLERAFENDETGWDAPHFAGGHSHMHWSNQISSNNIICLAFDKDFNSKFQSLIVEKEFSLNSYKPCKLFGITAPVSPGSFEIYPGRHTWDILSKHYILDNNIYFIFNGEIEEGTRGTYFCKFDFKNNIVSKPVQFLENSDCVLIPSRYIFANNQEFDLFPLSVEGDRIILNKTKILIKSN